MRIAGGNLLKLAAASLLVLGASARAQAESMSGAAPPDRAAAHHVQGYLFVAPGQYIGYADSVATLHLGGGGEVPLYRGVGIGAEIGGIAAMQESRGGMGLFSVNALYQFSHRDRVQPFVTGGYSSVFGRGQRNMINVGVGLNYWVREGRGIRLEFREHAYMDGSSRHLWGVRFGFTFR